MGVQLDKVVADLASSGILKWGSKGEEEQIVLVNPKARALLQTLLDGANARLDAESGTAREKAQTEEALFSSLEEAWVTAEEMPPVPNEGRKTTEPKGAVDSWLIEKVEVTGFGGINGCSAADPFVLGISEGSECFLGGNGSGKSSLISAIAWALTGQRINDSTGLSERSNTLHSVFDPAEPSKEVGKWAPLASYPKDRDGYKRPATVKVTLTFRKRGSEERATIERQWNSVDAPRTVAKWDPRLEDFKQCLDVSVEMPLRIAHLRIGEAGTLNDAISQLTGLDELTHVGQLVSSLKQKNGRFLNTPRQAEHDQQRLDLERGLDKAAAAQPGLNLELTGLRALASWVDKPDDYFQASEQIKKKLVAIVGEDLSTLKSYVNSSLDLKNEKHQQAVATAVVSAQSAYDPAHLSSTMKGTCRFLSAVGKLDSRGTELAQQCRDFANSRMQSLVEVASAHRRKLLDPKLSLKAHAARTHESSHGASPVLDCPLCDQTLSSAKLQKLGEEISRLKVEAGLLSQTLAAACREVISAVGSDRNSITSEVIFESLSVNPIEQVRTELRRLLIETHAFANTLPSLGELFDKGWSHAEESDIPEFKFSSPSRPSDLAGFETGDQSQIDEVWGKISELYFLAAVLEWGAVGVPAIRKAYATILGVTYREEKPDEQDSLRGLVSKLGQVVNRARPTNEAIEVLSHASQLARLWLPNERRKRTRQAIVDAIDPLKALPKFVEAEVSRQLAEMTSIIEPLAARFHDAAPFQFAGARLEREARQRRGLLRARAAPAAQPESGKSYELDASLVANSSWMRSLLWAFLFAIRDDRAKQLGGLPLPLMLLDDPQSTFDQEHGNAWIETVLDVPGGSCILPPPQVLFATYDVHFAVQVDLLIKGFPVRHISPAVSHSESVFVSGRLLVDRVWASAQKMRTNAACFEAIGELRKHLELMLKVIYPPALGAKATTLGELMSEFRGRLKGKGYPYNHPVFDELMSAWSDSTKDKYRAALSVPHHDLKPMYDYNFSERLFAWCLNDLYRAFYNAFEMMWSAQKAGWKPASVASIVASKARPIDSQGWEIQLPANMNEVVGRVAAESHGRGSEFGEPGVRLTLKKNMGAHPLTTVDACMVVAPTLEPVAFVGDVLLLSRDLPPTHNSLVVCEAVGVERARRFSELAGSNGAASLVASAVNPRETRNAIVVSSATKGTRKVVGVVFRCGWQKPAVSEAEVAPLPGMHSLEKLLSESEGLVQVVGESAEPIALDGQYLIIGSAISSKESLNRFDGKPIVALKGDGAVFKRLRLITQGVVLESLDISGRHPPVVVGEADINEVKFHPVLGVIFDPGQVKSYP